MDLKGRVVAGKKARGGSESSTELILLLSSGQSRRYRDDIIRVLALPTGGRLRFRYDKRHVPQTLVDQATGSGLAGCKVLIAYLDTTLKTGMEIVPCRFGNIVNTQTEGSFLVINFEVLGYAARSGPCVLKEHEIELVTCGRLPFREEDREDVSGEFCHIVKSDPGGFQSKESDLEGWQRIVTDLCGRPDFSDCPFFYTVTGVFEARNPEREVKPSEGRYVLKPDRLHGIKIVHYAGEQSVGHDGELCGQSSIIAEVEGHGIQQLTSQHPLVDSRYDVKTSYFRTLGKIEDQFGILSLSRKVAGDEHQDFEMTVKVKCAWARPAWIIPLIGASLAFPRLIELHRLDGLEQWETILVDFAAGLIAAALVLFGFRRMP